MKQLLKLKSMRKLKYISLTVVLSAFITGMLYSQAAKNNLILGLSYFNNNNQTQFLKANTKTKIDRKFQQVPGIPVSFYIGTVSPANLIGKATTNEKGLAFVFITPTAKDEWSRSSKQSFTVVADTTKLYDGTSTSIDLTKAKIKIDTGEDKKITAVLYELKDTEWVPVKGVDMKVAVKRMGGDLNVSETPTYTTDSLGTISADFKVVNLPGDSLGNLVLVARVEDNDIYGNLSTEKNVPWGVDARYIYNFNKRSLFARRGHSPLWLEWMAYSIIVAVWFILLYLFMQIRKLKKLGV